MQLVIALMVWAGLGLSWWWLAPMVLAFVWNLFFFNNLADMSYHAEAHSKIAAYPDQESF